MTEIITPEKFHIPELIKIDIKPLSVNEAWQGVLY